MAVRTKIAPASPKQKMILESNAQIMVIGGAAGSGKSYLLQMLPLRYINDPRTTCIMFRRTSPQLTGQGGLIDTARDIYGNLPKKRQPTYKVSDKEFKFPSGATLRYRPMEYEKDKYDYQGLQYTFVGFDEGTQFEWGQIEYLMSRLRSASRYQSRMVISCNPDPDHKLRELISWYLDEDGYPIPEKDGVIRYFIVEDGDFIWGNSREELGAKYGIPEKKWEGKILSFTFISSTIYDNPPMLENNPAYLAYLEGLNPVDKAQLLHGNWNARPQGSNYWERKWVNPVDTVPSGAFGCRAYDLAATERSQVNKYPDTTASVKMYKHEGYFYITGDYIPAMEDEDYDIRGRVVKRSGERDLIMSYQAEHDGEEIHMILPVDPSAAGKSLYTQQAIYFGGKGVTVKKDPVPNNKSKLVRFQPFATACENGLVRFVPHTFDKKTWEFICKELEAFDGERSTSQRKDDFVDAIASAYNYLIQAKVSAKVPAGAIVTDCPTKLHRAGLTRSHRR